MIGRLKGTLATKQPPFLLIDVGGVGYEVEAPLSTFFKLPALGEPLTLLTHLVVREDAHVLYGFYSEEERRLFRSLIKVNKIGAKLALAILSGMSVSDFVMAVDTQDVSSLSRIPGIGRKTAERLVMELRDKLDSDGVLPATLPGQVAVGSARGEAIAALQALGYKPQEAASMVKAAAADDSVEDIVRKALQGVLK